MATKKLSLVKVSKLFSHRARTLLAENLRKKALEAARLKREERRLKYEIGKEAKRVAERIAKRLTLAKKGLERIISTGVSTPMQQMLKAKMKLGGHAEVYFFEAKRPSGDDWFLDEPVNGAVRAVYVTFRQNFLLITYGTPSVEMDIRSVFYNDLIEHSQRCVYTRNPDEGIGFGWISVEDLLKEIAGPDASNMSVIHHPDQRSFEWKSRDIVFQLLVSCGRKSRFDNYLENCLKRLQ